MGVEARKGFDLVWVGVDPTTNASGEIDKEVAELSDHLHFWHAWSTEPKLRCYTSFEHRVGIWSAPRRVIAGIEASMHPDPTPADPQAMRQEQVHKALCQAGRRQRAVRRPAASALQGCRDGRVVWHLFVQLLPEYRNVSAVLP